MIVHELRRDKRSYEYPCLRQRVGFVFRSKARLQRFSIPWNIMIPDVLRRIEHVARGSLWKRFDITAQ
jgi:hypothetical protein